MKLVIIDDDYLVSGALKTILEASGEVTVSATGADGTDAVRLSGTPSGYPADGHPYEANGRPAGYRGNTKRIS